MGKPPIEILLLHQALAKTSGKLLWSLTERHTWPHAATLGVGPFWVVTITMYLVSMATKTLDKAKSSEYDV